MEYVRPLSHSSVLSRRENWPDLSFKKTPLMGCIEGKSKANHQEARRPLSLLGLETKQPVMGGDGLSGKIRVTLLVLKEISS